MAQKLRLGLLAVMALGAIAFAGVRIAAAAKAQPEGEPSSEIVTNPALLANFHAPSGFRATTCEQPPADCFLSTARETRGVAAMRRWLAGFGMKVSDKELGLGLRCSPNHACTTWAEADGELFLVYAFPPAKTVRRLSRLERSHKALARRIRSATLQRRTELVIAELGRCVKYCS